MSALPPKADKGQTSRDVRLVPIGDLSRRSNVSCPKSRAPRRLDVASGALVGVDNVRSIGYKPVVGDINPEGIDGRRSAAGPRERQLTRNACELPSRQ